MRKALLAVVILSFIATRANAQLGVMKLVGNNTSNYGLGYGVFIKAGYPVSQASDVTLELDGSVFFLNDGYGDADGTLVCPLKIGYRYTLNGSGTGLYVEPQAGYNLVGIMSLHDADGNIVNQNYHGVVFAAGAGYLFSLWGSPLDLNFHYETIIDDGGSTNYISLGLTTYLSFKKREGSQD